VTQKLLKIAGCILGMGVAFGLTVLALNNPRPETYARLLTMQLETSSDHLHLSSLLLRRVDAYESLDLLFEGIVAELREKNVAERWWA
jgi:hypothetical protein